MLNQVREYRHYAFLSTVYSCGLRLQEARNLEVKDIDSDRMLLHIHSKGARDRYVPLPDSTLRILKQNWLEHKNPRLIFPASGCAGDSRSTTQIPVIAGTVQRAMRLSLDAAGIHKKAHIHYIVPGGVITEDGFEWIPANKKLVVHTAPLAEMFRGKLVSILEKQGVLKKYNTMLLKKTCL